NRLFASHIESFTGSTPQCVCTREELDVEAFESSSMIFCDCDKTDVLSYCRTLHRPGYDFDNVPGITLINVQPDQDLLDEIKAFGIYGIFYSTDKFELISKGIRQVLVGDHWLSRGLLIRSLQSTREEMRKEKSYTQQALLTQREQEILTLIATGHDSQLIAEQLFISPNTVKTHVSNIYKKIDVTNRVQAILWATKNDLQLSQYPVLKNRNGQKVVPGKSMLGY
ncbi:MAG: response regulator transcription factor, partial [Chlorobium sp.]|nr:response regulator transcription factor [Chlorobium sp.]